MSLKLTEPTAPRSIMFWTVALLVLVLGQIATLYLMGRVPICECGYVKFFEPGVNTPGNSQHIADWYTPSHIIHGFIFYLLACAVMRRASFGAQLTLASVIEIGWEILENSPIIIDRYRNETMAIGYNGDSILNSAMDTMWMMIGFLFASRMPVWVTIAVALALELLAALLIRDNLTLNVLMLIWPVDAIRNWQSAF